MKAPSQAAVVDALARDRLLPFVMMVFGHLKPQEPPLQPSWYLRAMCYWLERVAAGSLPRSMIWIQPRFLKSITVAVAFPCWILGRNPSAEIMVATYGQGLGRQHGDQRRSILKADWYRRLFAGTVIAAGGDRQDEVVTTRGGRILIISPESRSTGSGADFIIFDDLITGADANSEAARAAVKSWIDNTVVHRLNPRGDNAIISIQQRLHEDDPAAYLRDKGYACLCLPAIGLEDLEIEIGPGVTHLYRRNDMLCPELMSREQLEEKRIESGAQIYSAQYLQNPVALEGNLVRLDHFRRFEMEIPRDRFEKVFQSWDTAVGVSITADWSVGTTWGYLAGRLFLIHIYRARVEYPDLKKAVIALHSRFRPDRVLMEKSNNGTGLIQDFRKNGPVRLIEISPRLGKVERLVAQTGQIEEGRMFLPAKLDGLDNMLGELRAFPHGRHDDLVDSMTQMLEWTMNHWQFADREFMPDGRPVAVLRNRKRPPLPPLPSWIH
ncbi:phage terminase large subunit [Sphingomonas bacterium]|uniref:phage terminase large subunit n=1 Tax=Sphingomonas bacterium TaxID=1895847 RepID=UPI0015750302|nr:phage terminase large subunit [Sphingomonas bacterium]